MRRYQAVLLDVDGTLVDSNDQHAHAWSEVLEDAGYAAPYLRVRQMIGMGGDRLVEEITGHEKGSRKSEKLSERRSEVFAERWLPKVKSFERSRELLLRLRSEGYQFALASAAKAEELQGLLAAGGLADLCDERTTSSDVAHSKPAPDTIEAALAHVHVDRSRVVMIGDTPYDVRAGRDAAVDVIGFASGGWPANGLAGAVAVYDGPWDLLARWRGSPLDG